MGVGRFKDGVQNAKRRVDQVPNELVPLRRVANAYYIAGDIASGDDAMETVDEIYGDRPEFGFIRLQAAVLARRWSEADQRLASSVKDERARTAYALAFNALRSGNPVSRSTAIASLKEMMPTARGPWIALLLAQLGERDAALVILAGFTLVASMLGHPFWLREGTPFIRDATTFLEHLGLVAGLLLVTRLGSRRADAS